jgi:peptidyl-tRNA hydrolase, PTH1 family
VAKRAGTSLRSERGIAARIGTTERDGHLVALAVPTTFMNDSGVAVADLCRRFSVSDFSRLVIVHDELDLDPGVVRVKIGGGTAGHNGLRSIESHLRSLDFVRVRIGIGKPPGRSSGADYVLRRPSGTGREVLEVSSEVAADAIELIFDKGAAFAMTTINQR